MALLSYLGCVNIGVEIVREQFPDAVLFEVQGAAADNTYVPSSTDISHLHLVFQAEEGRGTAFISTTIWGEFGPVHAVAVPWLEDVIIPWPIEMDATEADELLRAHYDELYDSMVLRHPLYPGADEPYYIFHLKEVGFVFVGVNSKKVFRPDQELAEKMAIPKAGPKNE
ncbi:hypothetical protein O9K51_06426 [Purpureocillium lavendulum]|uniref:Uncharacterized protein n=1 Tax=Purpureocillium lavendulum TaxID=1247861 RepID=A0AB34FQI2_9HYPO|nr:hypothetical protein O9K51_06426 [Purpureocillium lavendulum]